MSQTRGSWRLVAGVLAGPVFVITFLIEGATRAGYDALRQPVSSLAIGEPGWIQQANFFVTALLTLALAAGLRPALRASGRRSGAAPILVAIMGIGLAGAGAFVADPYNGYPPGTPLIPVERTTVGVLHDMFSALLFGGFAVLFIVLGRRFLRQRRTGWAWYSFVSAVAFVVAFALTSVGLNQVEGLANIAGLWQRTTLVIGFTWLSVVSLHLLRAAKETLADQRALATT
jgi:hypothetical protein